MGDSAITKQPDNGPLPGPLPARGTPILPIATAAALIAMGLTHWLISPDAARILGLVSLGLTSIPLLWQTVREAARGNFATDAVAALAILTALVMRQPVPGLIIVLMQSGGELLERSAQRRASRALRELQEGAPRIAHRWVDDRYDDVAVGDVQVGDQLLVRPGEVVPVDGVVLEGRSSLDTAAITGEPTPVAAHAGTQLFSGFWNGSSPLVMKATALATESQYERIVQLVRSAQERQAPIQRLADKYAVWFTPITVAVAIAAFVFTGDANRVLAVLVVATPCPLILATPVAIIGGMNRAARAGVIFRSGVAIEELSRVNVAVFDKTGTLTTGKPAVKDLVTFNNVAEADLLRWSAAVEQGSGHTLAREVVRYAADRGIVTQLADDVEEFAGRGVHGSVDGHQIMIGSEDFIAETIGVDPGSLPGANRVTLRTYIAVDRELAGFIEFEDQLRPDLTRMLDQLRETGFTRILVLSGDDAETVRDVANELGITEAYADLKPEQKLDIVREIQAQGTPVLMIGDGTNDAPALAEAAVGVAVTPRGGGIAAETADIVILGENLNRVHDAIETSHRTLRIAKQSIIIGLGLSVGGMIAAFAGYLPPIAGALFQEAIDVAVILNAARAAVDGR